MRFSSLVRAFDEYSGSATSSAATIASTGSETLAGGSTTGASVGPNSVSERELVDYLITNMVLVNAVITVPEELDYRMHLRNQWFAAGLGDTLGKVRGIGSALLATQFEACDIEAENDQEELLEYYDGLKADLTYVVTEWGLSCNMLLGLLMLYSWVLLLMLYSWVLLLTALFYSYS